eukprot:364640-Chlamydomonas_euryale.AAC.5
MGCSHAVLVNHAPRPTCHAMLRPYARFHVVEGASHADISMHSRVHVALKPRPLQVYLPLDMRTKKTRAIRRRLTKEQVGLWWKQN